MTGRNNQGVPYAIVTVREVSISAISELSAELASLGSGDVQEIYECTEERDVRYRVSSHDIAYLFETLGQVVQHGRGLGRVEASDIDIHLELEKEDGEHTQQ